MLNNVEQTRVVVEKANGIFESATVAVKCVRARMLAGEGDAKPDWSRILAIKYVLQKARFWGESFDMKTNDYFVQLFQPKPRRVFDR